MFEQIAHRSLQLHDIKRFGAAGMRGPQRIPARTTCGTQQQRAECDECRVDRPAHGFARASSAIAQCVTPASPYAAPAARISPRSQAARSATGRQRDRAPTRPRTASRADDRRARQRATHARRTAVRRPRARLAAGADGDRGQHVRGAILLRAPPLDPDAARRAQRARGHQEMHDAQHAAHRPHPAVLREAQRLHRDEGAQPEASAARRGIREPQPVRRAKQVTLEHRRTRQAGSRAGDLDARVRIAPAMQHDRFGPKIRHARRVAPQQRIEIGRALPRAAGCCRRRPAEQFGERALRLPRIRDARERHRAERADPTSRR